MLIALPPCVSGEEARRGVVVNEAGDPAVAALIVPSCGGVDYWDHTDGNGQFEFLGPCRYLTVLHDDYVPQYFELRSEDTDLRLEVLRRPGDAWQIPACPQDAEEPEWAGRFFKIRAPHSKSRGDDAVSWEIPGRDGARILAYSGASMHAGFPFERNVTSKRLQIRPWIAGRASGFE